jgi:antirestriction protein ArdC
MKGEKGITILAPKMIRKTSEDSSGKPVIGADGKPVKKSQCVGFTTATVFDISQTDGKPLPDNDLVNASAALETAAGW